MPNAQEMFGETSPKDLAAKNEAFETALKGAVASPNLDPMFKQKVDAGLPQAFTKKSLSADGVAALNDALATSTADIAKDISLTSPLNSSFAAFDLEAPAKYLVPVPTPLRNKLPRTKGVGLLTASSASPDSQTPSQAQRTSTRVSQKPRRITLRSMVLLTHFTSTVAQRSATPLTIKSLLILHSV